MNHPVSALANFNGEMFAGGAFTTAGGTPANNVARWNASTWQPVGNGLSGNVNAFSTFEYDLIAGSNFNINGSISVARWNGTVWQPTGTGINGSVQAIAGWSTGLVAAGSFTGAGGVAVNNIAFLYQSGWRSLNGGMNNSVNALTLLTNGNLVAAGDFTTAGGVSASRIAMFDGVSWFPLGAGMSQSVQCLTLYNNSLIAGGGFSTAGSSGANFIARWNGSDWQALGSGMNGTVSALTAYKGDLIAGGFFTSAGGGSANYIARWNGSTWQPLGGGMNNYVLALTVYNGELIAAGRFTTADNAPANRIARWNGFTWQPLGTGMNSAIMSVSLFNNDLVACGQFTTAGGVSAKSIARWNGSAWQPVGTGMNSDVYSLKVVNGDLFAGGAFTTANGLTAHGIVSIAGPKWLPSDSNPHLFSDPASWSTGLPPDSQCYAVFGKVQNAGPIVSFSSNVSNTACSVTNQSTLFELGGHQYSVSSRTTIGDEQYARLAITNGVFSSAISIAPLGTLMGDATIVGNITNDGTLLPGLGIESDGELSHTGSYSQSSGGVFQSEFYPTHYGRLTIDGDAALSGTIKMSLHDNANPIVNFYPVLTCTGQLTGSFTGALFPYLGPDKAVSLQYINAATGSGGQDPKSGGGGTDGGTSGVVIVVGAPAGSPDFGQPQTFVLEGEPTGIWRASVNNVSKALDIALCVKGPTPNSNGNVLLLLNQGNGTAFTPVVRPVGVGPVGIVAANLADGGSNDDIAVVNQGSNQITVLFHDPPIGGSNFTSISIPIPGSPSAIAAADLRGNGLVDLAITQSATNTVTILLNNGDRTFTAQPPIAVGANPSSIAAGRFINGTLPDLAVANKDSNSVIILQNLGPGALQSGAPVFNVGSPIPVGPTPVVVRPGTLDNPRDQDDLIVSSQGPSGATSGTISIIKNLQNGNFASPVILPIDGAPGALAAWDMDADGDLDVAAVVDDADLGEPIISILRNDTAAGQLAFTLLEPIGQGENPALVSGADVTGDSLEDLVTVNVTTIPFKGNSGGGTDGSRPDSSLSIRPTLLKVPRIPGDINGDGHVNVIDLLAVIQNWGPCPNPHNPCPADIAPPPNGNGSVNVADLLMVINNWG